MKRYPILFFTVAALFILVMPYSPPAWSASDENLKKALALNDSAIQKSREGNLDGAEIDLLQAVEYSDVAPKVKKNLGVVYFEKASRAVNQKKDFREAQRYYRQALEIDPSNDRYRRGMATALYLEANACAAAGQIPQALGLYEKTLTYDPTNFHALMQSAYFSWKTQKFDLSKGYLARAKAINPGSSDVRTLEDKIRMEERSGNLDTGTSEHFVLAASDEYLNSMGSHNVLYELEQAFNEISYKLSYYPKGKITVVLYPVKDFHEHWALPSRVNGYFDGKLRIPYASKKTTVQMMKPIMLHELTHSFVNSMNQTEIPKWLNEGLAQWVEGKSMDPKSIKALMTYEVTKKTHDLGHLDSVLSAQKNPFNGNEMTLAYMKSFSIVQYLIEQNGIWAVMGFIKEYRSPDDTNRLFEKNFKADPNEVEESWRKWLARR